jgi:hypothetical protein
MPLVPDHYVLPTHKLMLSSVGTPSHYALKVQGKLAQGKLAQRASPWAIGPQMGGHAEGVRQDDYGQNPMLAPRCDTQGHWQFLS